MLFYPVNISFRLPSIYNWHLNFTCYRSIFGIINYLSLIILIVLMVVITLMVVIALMVVIVVIFLIVLIVLLVFLLTPSPPEIISGNPVYVLMQFQLFLLYNRLKLAMPPKLLLVCSSTPEHNGVLFSLIHL